MGKLHEVLAVEPDRKATAVKLVQEGVNTFTKKLDHFNALHRVFRPDAEDGLEQPEDTKPMVTTVTDKLNYVDGSLAEWLDLKLQKEECNTRAKADLVLEDGTVVLKAAPATFLLGLESDLKLVRDLYEAVPTLPPGEEWKKEEGTNVWVAEEKRVKTKKVYKNHILADATKEHPAQVQVYSEDERVGLVTTIKRTSVLTPGEKSQMLGRIDALIAAAKKARQRANSEKVDNSWQIGKRLFAFVNTGSFSEQTQH